MKVKAGQVYEQPNGEIFVITCIDEDSNVHLIYKDGYTASYKQDDYTGLFIFDKLLAELPSWRDAIVKLEEYDE